MNLYDASWWECFVLNNVNKYTYLIDFNVFIGYVLIDHLKIISNFFIYKEKMNLLKEYYKGESMIVLIENFIK